MDLRRTSDPHTGNEIEPQEGKAQELDEHESGLDDLLAAPAVVAVSSS
jgi:hypothetical protein